MRNNEKRFFPVDYTSRDQQSIREDLDNYARNYYAKIYNNFSENSFESLVLDLISYEADNLSFYLDYQANEMLLDGASEFENIRQIGKQKGYKYRGRPSSFAMQTFYVIVPASSTQDGPDVLYFPTLKRGTKVLSNSGGVYTLLDDLTFTLDDEIVVSQVDSSTGLPTFYAVKARGRIISGETKIEQINVGSFERFLNVSFEDEDFSEIISVFDLQGNEYFEVEHLTQNTIFRPVANFGATKNEPQSLLRPFAVPRRFTVDFDDNEVFLQFGMGQINNARTINNRLDPSNSMIQKHGKQYISDFSFDPTNLVKGDKMGIVPTNTTLFVAYRANTDITSNAEIGAITDIVEPIVEFQNREQLNETTIYEIINSFETENEEPVVGETLELTQEELKMRIMGSESSQMRGVTPQDYVSLCYKMPSRYGSIKRVNVVTDPQSAKRNLNLYIVSEDSEGNFIQSNDAIKENLKIWLNHYKMINDTIDILDGKIVNFGIDYEITTDINVDKYEVLNEAFIELRDYFEIKMSIGESINITEIYKVLRDVDGLVDVLRLEIFNKTLGNYSTTYLNIDEQMTIDGRFVVAPKNVVFELKYPERDIRGFAK